MDESSILIRRLSLSSAESTHTREAFFSAQFFISFLFFSIFSSPSDRNWFDFIQVNYARVWGGKRQQLV
jgi:hypothetical protein